MKKNSDFGMRLENLCEERGIPINQLARRLSISPKTIYEWMGKSGRLPRKPEHLKSLCRFFGVSLEYLLFGEESSNELKNLVEKIDLHTGVYEISLKRISPRKD